jgi:hypothetical protein
MGSTSLACQRRTSSLWRHQCSLLSEPLSMLASIDDNLIAEGGRARDASDAKQNGPLDQLPMTSTVCTFLTTMDELYCTVKRNLADSICISAGSFTTDRPRKLKDS